MRILKAILVGVVGAFVGTVLGGSIYALSGAGAATTASDLGFVSLIAIMNPLPKLIVGAIVGLCAAALLRRSSFGAIATVGLATLGGSVIGYGYTVNAIHVVPGRAIASVTAGWLIVATVFVLAHLRLGKRAKQGRAPVLPGSAASHLIAADSASVAALLPSRR